ncbi:tetratricopeptide (TPR) repeat protein [Kibdelosporangium banguiense]|uniref:Tetratricopeptide (TPR) repeat protein n=1 Tax=Kibdelosporangium banguiense TaxID=1365924 RepID=A0ABS4T6V1_9PSEU|nr:tetratricopeptide repeat protein [Kibdelosporangium banguiense]MBP2320113.1 tetratricopeptide (TPR) repeat protein [Kibdelosporangium banguiense]
MDDGGRPQDVGNKISGSVVGPAVQAGSISGGVHFHQETANRLPVPRQLLAPPAHFTSRNHELGVLDEILTTGSPALIVLSGPGGVGKTALALQWAHRISTRFPDGQLYVDLAGFSETAPVAPGDALGLFLRALGITPDNVPVGLAEQAALYRSLTAGRSLLVLLDNAYSAAQVRALLPAPPDSAVIVTSRSRLIGLVPHGGQLVEVGPLPTPDAVQLLASTVGRARVTQERERAEQLVDMCGGLPIAVCVAAARLATRPRLSVGRVAAELADERRRLAGLSAHGLSVQAAFDVSYKSLEAPVATLYRRLGLHPGQDFGPGVAAAVTPDDEDRALENLIEDNLLEEIQEDRYRFHDLLRLHARQRAAAEDTPQERDAALRDILEWYLAMALSADQVLTPYRRRPFRYEFQSGRPRPSAFADRDEALSWLDSERVNLIAAGRTALDRQWPTLAWHLCDVMWPLLLYRKHYRDRLDIDFRGVQAARAWSNKWAEAEMLKRLGRVSTVLGRHGQAEEQLHAAEQLFDEQDDRLGVSAAREYLALLYLEIDRLADATRIFEDLLVTHRELGADRNVGLDLINLGLVLPRQRRANEAIERLSEAHEIFTRLAGTDPFNGARAMTALAEAYRQAGQPDQARAWATRAARAMTELGSDFGQAEVHEVLAEIAASQGDLATAADHLRLALEIFDSAFSARADPVRARLRELTGE